MIDILTEEGHLFYPHSLYTEGDAVRCSWCCGINTRFQGFRLFKNDGNPSIELLLKCENHSEGLMVVRIETHEGVTFLKTRLIEDAHTFTLVR